MAVIVVGLGNPILGDDGVGIQVVRALAARLAPRPDLTLTEASVGGLRLMELLVGYERALIVDAIHTGRAVEGTVHEFPVDALRAWCPTRHSASAHDMDLLTALAVGRQLGLPLPAEVHIVAVEIRPVDAFDERLSPRVAAAVPQAVARAWAWLHARPVAALPAADRAPSGGDRP